MRPVWYGGGRHAVENKTTLILSPLRRCLSGGVTGPECSTHRRFDASDLADFEFMSSQICSYESDEFMSMCLGDFVGMVLCAFGVFSCSGKDLVVRRPIFLGNHPQPKYVQRSWFPISLDWPLKGFLKPLKVVNFVQGYE